MPPGERSQMAATRPHLSDHGNAKSDSQFRGNTMALSLDLPKSKMQEITGRMYAAAEIHAREFFV